MLPKLRLCISAGAPLPIPVAKKFLEKFHLPIHSFYGSSECGGICYDREAANPSEGFVGEAMKGVKIEIVEYKWVGDPDSSCTAPLWAMAISRNLITKSWATEFYVPDDLLARGFSIQNRQQDHG